MARRIDATRNSFKTFRELLVLLEAGGIEVDHFHAVELLPVDPGESGSEEFVAVVEETLTAVIKEVYHLHIFRNNEGLIEEALWSDDPHKNVLDEDPRGWYSLVADEWHDR